MKLLACRLWERATYAAWGMTGWRLGWFSARHYRAESALRREEGRRAERREANHPVLAETYRHDSEADKGG